MKLSSLIVLICSIVLIHPAFAQSISRSVTSSVGITQTNGNTRLSYTVGEPVIGTMSAGKHQLGNGFYQSLNMSFYLIKPEYEYLTGVRIYPNPVTENFIIREKDNHPLEIRISDQQTRIIKEAEVNSGDIINASEWKPGIYFLNTKDKLNNQVSVFKIVIL